MITTFIYLAYGFGASILVVALIIDARNKKQKTKQRVINEDMLWVLYIADKEKRVKENGTG